MAIARYGALIGRSDFCVCFFLLCRLFVDHEGKFIKNGEFDIMALSEIIEKVVIA